MRIRGGQAAERELLAMKVGKQTTGAYRQGHSNFLFCKARLPRSLRIGFAFCESVGSTALATAKFGPNGKMI